MAATLGVINVGVGSIPYVAERHGFQTDWVYDNLEKRRNVCAAHFPNVAFIPKLSDITGDMLSPVDVMAVYHIGSSFAVADATWYALRLCKEMRRATNGVYPRFFVWEGAKAIFTSNQGEDFRNLVERVNWVARREEGVSSVIPSVVSIGEWANAGLVSSTGCQLCWRTINTLYWGRPLHNQRVFLVADFGGRSGPHILYRQGGRGDDDTGVSSESGGQAGCSASAERRIESLGQLADVSISHYPSANSVRFPKGYVNRFRGIKRTLLFDTIKGALGVRTLTEREWLRVFGMPDDWLSTAPAVSVRPTQWDVVYLNNVGALPVWDYVLEGISESM